MDYKEKILNEIQMMDNECEKKFLAQIFIMIRRHKERSGQ